MTHCNPSTHSNTVEEGAETSLNTQSHLHYLNIHTRQWSAERRWHCGEHIRIHKAICATALHTAVRHALFRPRALTPDWPSWGSHGRATSPLRCLSRAELSRAARFTDRGRHPVTAVPGALRRTLRQERKHEDAQKHAEMWGKLDAGMSAWSLKCNPAKETFFWTVMIHHNNNQIPYYCHFISAVSAVVDPPPLCHCSPYYKVMTSITESHS